MQVTLPLKLQFVIVPPVVPTHAAGSADRLAVAYIAVSDFDVLHPAVAADVTEQAGIISRRRRCSTVR